MSIEASLTPWVVGGLVLGILKHQGVLDLSWWWVFGVAFAPVWIALAAIAVLGTLAGLCAVGAAIITAIDGKREDY